MDLDHGRLNDMDGFKSAHQRHVDIIEAGFGRLARAYSFGNAKVLVSQTSRAILPRTKGKPRAIFSSF